MCIYSLRRLNQQLKLNMKILSVAIIKTNVYFYFLKIRTSKFLILNEEHIDFTMF